jgi:hypothetical protein
MADEGRLLAGVEEAHSQVVIGCGRGRYEGHLGMGELARDGRHGRIALAVRVENHRGRITLESRARERIDLKDSHPPPSPRRLLGSARSFARPRPARYTSAESLGWSLGPETQRSAANPSNLNRVMPA